MIKIELATYSTALVLTYEELKELRQYLQLSLNALNHSLQGCIVTAYEKQSIKLAEELLAYCDKQIESVEF